MNTNTYYPLGAIGMLMQWTLDDGRVLRTPMELEAAMAEAVAAGDGRCLTCCAR